MGLKEFRTRRDRKTTHHCTNLGQSQRKEEPTRREC